MKKRNFITGFSAAFVATIALVSCGGIKSKDGVVLTIGGHEYTAQELFEGQKTPAAAEAKFNAVYKVAVRRYFDNDQEGHTYMGDITRDTKLKVAGAKEEAKTNASKNGTKYKTEWEKILSSNGVDDETGLYNKFEYDLMKTKFDDVFYSRTFPEQTTAEGKKYTTNYDVLRSGGKLRDNKGDECGTYDGIKGYLNYKNPYHMKHILVKINAKEKDNTSGEITQAEAYKIYRVIKMLANGDTFEEVSEVCNEDSSAKDNKGSLGIMSRDTSFVNDFKLGTYMFESFFQKGTTDAALKGLELTNGGKGTAGYYAEKLNTFDDPTTSDLNAEEGKGGKGIGQIPYGEVLKLASSTEETEGVGDIEYKTYEAEFIKAGLSSSDIKAKYYPRNVIFNKYFNKHNIMVVTPTAAPKLDDVTALNYYIRGTTSGGTERTEKHDNDYRATEEYGDYVKLPGFNEDKTEGTPRKNPGDEIVDGKLPNGTNKNVLRDNNGRIVFVFRSGTSGSKTSNADTYQGIHFVVVERSPFIAVEQDYKDDEHTKTSLEEYYTQYYPLETGSKHPKYTEDGITKKYEGKNKRTYANWIINETEVTKQKTRSDTIKTELKKADDNLNTYVYDYLVTKGGINFSSTAIAQNIKLDIDNWIKFTKQDATKEERETKWADTWRTYYNSLIAQKEERKETVVDTTEGNETIVSRMVPEICIYAFQNAFQKTATNYTLKQLFGVGGVFHD